MTESKRTPVPLPPSKPKPKPKTKSIPSRVHDASTSENTSQLHAPKQPKTFISIHNSNTIVPPKSKSSTKQNATPAPASPAKALSNQSGLKQTKAQMQAVELSSSEESDGDDTSGRENRQEFVGDDSEQDSTSGSDSSSDESDTHGAPQYEQHPVREHAGPPKSQSHVVEFQPAQPYKPPRGFNPVPLNDKTISKVANIFNRLDGKQVWHITAPAGVSLKDLKQFSLNKAMGGEAILNQNGADYGLSKSAKGEDGMREVVVPRSDGYKAVPARILHTLHLQTAIRLPELEPKHTDQTTASEATESITRSTIRAPRPQVKGLKMRFLPSGFGGDDAGALGDSDSDDGQRGEAAGKRLSQGPGLPYRKEKRKHADVNGTGKAEVPSKKSKKHRSTDEMQRKEEQRFVKDKKRMHGAAL